MRIYALAKKLKLDSKILVDICNKVGITGKGSALASLTDEEMAKVTGYLEKRHGEAGGAGAGTAKAGGRAAGGKAVSETKVFRREDYIAPAGATGGEIRVLEDKLPKEKPPPKERPSIGPIASKTAASDGASHRPSCAGTSMLHSFAPRFCTRDSNSSKFDRFSA